MGRTNSKFGQTSGWRKGKMIETTYPAPVFCGHWGSLAERVFVGQEVSKEWRWNRKGEKGSGEVLGGPGFAPRG